MIKLNDKSINLPNVSKYLWYLTNINTYITIKQRLLYNIYKKHTLLQSIMIRSINIHISASYIISVWTWKVNKINSNMFLVLDILKMI